MINTLHLGLSYNCNMKCKHCFVNKNNDHIEVSRLYEVLDYLDEKGLFVVVYTFGEPLMSKYFLEVSKYISNKKIVQVLMTNGSLINDDYVVKLKENNVRNVYISIDSIKEEKHDLNRNYNGAYKKAITSIEKLRDNGFNIGIATTINETNVLEMDDIINLAKKLNINNVSFLRQRNDGKLFKFNNIEKYYEFYEKYLKNYGNYGINVVFHDFSLIYSTVKLYELGMISKSLYEKYVDMNSCHYNTTLSIEPNGNVKHCNLVGGTICNINDDLEKILIKERGFENEGINACF